MTCARIVLILACALTSLRAQESPEGPSNEKAQKTYQQALQYLREHRTEWAR